MRIVTEARIADHAAVLRTRYAGDPHFVHPEVGFLRRVLAGRSAFLRHGRARAFAARQGDEPVGFAVAFIDPRLQSGLGRPVGSVGFLEARGRAAAEGVLGAACEWLRDQGIGEVWAPFNGHLLFGLGLREDRFDEPPFLGCSHAPPADREHLLGFGFRPMTRLSNYEVDLTGQGWRTVPPEAPGVHFRRASRVRFRREIARFVDLYNRAFGSVAGGAEVSLAEGLELLSGARMVVHPELFPFAVVDGEEAGFAFAVPDLFEVLAPQHRPLISPAAIGRIAARRRRVRTVGLLVIGVAPEHQGRGIGTALVARVARAAAHRGFRRLEYALVDEGNMASRATIARLGSRPCRTFGLYSRTLT